MPKREVLRDRIVGHLDADLISQRRAAGWRIAVVEWEREGDTTPSSAEIELPYGMRVAGDCHHMEEDPEEGEALRIVMRMVTQDRPLSKIAEELNHRGYRTRAGNRWTISDVFRLMPVLVESGPRIFADASWATARTA